MVIYHILSLHSESKSVLSLEFVSDLFTRSPSDLTAHTVTLLKSFDTVWISTRPLPVIQHLELKESEPDFSFSSGPM